MINLTADIDTEKAKRNLEGLKQSAKRVVSGMINDFELLDSAVIHFNKTLGGVGSNFHIPALSAKIKQAQNEFNKLEGFIMSPQLTESASKEVNAFIASLERLDKVLMGIPSRANSFDAIASSMRDLVAQADIFINKIGQIQQSAIPIPNKTPAQSAPTSSNAQSTAPMIEAASYRELLRELQAVSGTKLQLIGQIEALKAKNREYKSTVDAVNKAESDGMRISQERASQRRNASLAIEQNKVLIQSLQRELKEQIKVEQTVETSINDLTASLKRMQTVYSQLDAEQRQSPFGQNLHKNIEELEQRINGVGVAMQAQTQKVGYYASGFNGLSFQIQQVARELPSLAYGPQVFFGAISNNLPMLTDEIARARTQYNELIKSGQKATPVWKQMLSSLVSWQTLFVAGITVMTLYGKEIVDWTASLFKGRKEIDSAKIALEQFHATMTQGTIAAQDEITKLDLLYHAATDAAKPYEERKKAVERLQDIYPAYFGNMDSEMIMAGQLKGKYDELKASIIEAAQARAAFDEMVENNKILSKIERTDEYKEVQRISLIIDKIRANISKLNPNSKTYIGESFNIEQYEKQIDRLSKTIRKKLDLSDEIPDDIRQYVSSLNQAIYDLAKPAGKQFTGTTPDETNDAAKKAREEAKRAAEQTLKDEERRRKEIESALAKITLDAQQAEIDAMAEGTEKKVAQIELDYKKREAAIKDGEAELIKLQKEITPEQQSQIQSLRFANEKIRQSERHEAIAGKPANIDLSQDFEDDIKAWEDYYEQYGTFRERLQATKDKYDRKLSEAKNDGERASIAAEYDAALAEFEVQASTWAKELTNLAVSQLERLMTETEKSLEAAQKTFDALDDSSSPEAQQWLSTINKLQARIKVLEGQLNKTKKAASDGDWGKAATALNAIADGARESLNGIRDLDEGLADILETLINVATSAGSFVDSIQGIKGGDLSFGSISGGITSAIGLISSIVGLFKGGESSMERNIRLAKEFNEELRIMNERAKINSDAFSSIFGDNTWENYTNNINLLNESASKYGNTLQRVKKRGKEVVVDFGEYGGRANLQKVDKTWESETESVANMLVQTRHSTWFRSAKYKSLKDLLPELFEGNEINMEGLKKFVESNNNTFKHLGRENQEYLKGMVADWDTYQQAVEAVNDYLTDMLGGLGSSLTDALVDSFESGTDAAEAFGDAVGDMLKNIAKQILYNATLAPLINEAQAQIEEINKNSALSDEDRFNGYTKVIGDLMDQVLAEQQAGQDIWERLQKMAEEKGIDWADETTSSQSATSRGFETMSQDTGNELSGRFSDMQGKMNILVSGMDMLRSINMETRNTSIDIRDIMIQLNGNVADIRTYTKVLPAMSDTLTSMNKKLDNL